uniref:HTH psq-type domain-containing protein n=1 Tax=Timema poppense TaxID=170557 RepID=A0A7R9DNR5_TIMPO|nr:unnamed protein product [Timema poppensis]
MDAQHDSYRSPARRTDNLHDKLSVIEKLEKGVSVSTICAEYGIAKQTVSDIKKSKSDSRSFVLKKENSEVKRMRMPTLVTLDDAVYKWFSQLRSSGLAVRGISSQAASERLSKQMGLEQFKPSSKSNKQLWQGHGKNFWMMKKQLQKYKIVKQDYRDTLQRGGEESVSLDDVEAWFEADEDNPGFQISTE